MKSPMTRLGHVCFSVNVVACLAVALASGDMALAQAKHPGAQPLAVIELGKLPQAPLYWHLDTYLTRAAAEAAKGARGTVVEVFDRVWLFTRADVVANIGVILAGVLVWWLANPYPDYVIGTLIGLYVIKEAIEILHDARRASTQVGKPTA